MKRVVPLPQVEDAVRAAMQRIIAGTPTAEGLEPGRTSLEALAIESGVPRNRLNREYSHLRDEFRDLLAEANADSEPQTLRELELAQQLADAQLEIARLSETNGELRSSHASWKRAAETFIRVINAKEVELMRVQTSLATERKAKERYKRAAEGRAEPDPANEVDATPSASVINLPSA